MSKKNGNRITRSLWGEFRIPKKKKKIVRVPRFKLKKDEKFGHEKIRKANKGTPVNQNLNRTPLRGDAVWIRGEKG